MRSDLVLVCDCGQTFDDIKTAHRHLCDLNGDRAYEIMLRSEVGDG